MKPGMVRRGLTAFAALVLLGLLAVVALPLVASTQIVRDRIAQELSVWSGYRVAISEAPEIDVWPVFRARLDDVSFTDAGSGGAQPAIEAETIEVDLSALAALRGDVVFSRMVVMRPLVRLHEDRDGRTVLDGPGQGRLAAAIGDARDAVARSPEQAPASGDLPHTHVGDVEFREGRVVIVRDGRDEPMATSLTGRLQWAALNRPATLDMTGIWRGETLDVDVSSAAPLLLLSGATAPLKLSLTSQPATLTFDGEAVFGDEPFLQGRATVASPSLKRLAEWLDMAVPGVPTTGAFGLSGQLAGNHERVKIENAEVDFGESRGSGLIEMTLTGETPSVAGTLAFATLNLRPLLTSFSPMAAGNAEMADPVVTGLVGRTNLDLRLSANSATLGQVALSEVAATIQARDGTAALDISDATAFGGTIQAGLRIDASGAESAVELKILADNVDAGALALQAQWTRFVPQARASLSLIARGAGSDWRSVLADAEGSLTATLGQGTIIGVDLAAFMTRASQGRFFPLSETAGGALPLRAASLRGTIDNGVLRLERAHAEIDHRTLTLHGMVPYVDRALALSGDIAPTVPPSNDSQPDARFFIGGGWDAPFISPMIGYGDF